MVDAVLLVLREVLEAALMFSLLLALSRRYDLRAHWSLLALILGIIGSLLLANYAYEISDAMEGMGQELLNALLFGVVTLSFVMLAIILIPKLWRGRAQQQQTILLILCVMIVSTSLMREASEIWVYLSSFTQRPDALSSALIGAAIGTGIGLSLGAITYYLLIFMRDNIFLPIFLLIITLLAGGLSMQIAKQLLQTGILDSTDAVWDSSFIVNEQSWLGELLHALLGYDAQPTPLHIIFYALTVAPILVATAHAWWLTRGKVHV